MLSKYYVAVCVLVMAFSSSVTARDRVDIREGEWEFSVEYRLTDFRQEYPQYTMSQCISADDPIPRFTLENQECGYDLHRNVHGNVSWQMTCSNDQEMVQGMGRVNFWDDEFYGTVNLQIMGPTQFRHQRMFYTLYGQYKGPCKSN